MNQTTAIQQLIHFDELGRYVWAKQDLSKLFSKDSPRAFNAGLQRLVAKDILIRAIKGVYVFGLSRHKGGHTLEFIARVMRRGEYNYVSLESALSEYGVISQIPIDRLTVMTTGRKGEYKTPFGTLEFTHTQRPVNELISSMVDVGRPLRMATKRAALRDLKRVGRNTHLVNEDEGTS